MMLMSTTFLDIFYVILTTGFKQNFMMVHELIGAGYMWGIDGSENTECTQIVRSLYIYIKLFL